MEYAWEIQNLYNEFCEDVCYLPVLSGKKTEGEKFAGAEMTLTREIFSQDGQFIQTGTSHYLGQSFGKTYNISFQNKDNKLQTPYYTSHGITTRLLGVLIVTHADNKGLVLPFDIAPIQIAILPIFPEKNQKILKLVAQVQKKISKYRIFIDNSNNGFGYKVSQQELQGTPFTLIIGNKEAEENKCMLIRRDNGEKQLINIKDITKQILLQKKEYYKNIYNKAKKHLDESIVEVNNMEEFKKAIADKKIALAY